MRSNPEAARRSPLPRNGRIAAGALVLLLGGCSGGETAFSEAAQRGRGTYNEVCIACHNSNPALAGSVGPAVAGSSLELLTARVVRGEYPPGYTPKSNSNAMPAFPQLADRVGDLHAFLEESAD